MVSGFGRLLPPRSPVRDGFLTPIRSLAAAEFPNNIGASRKIGGKTACGSMRPGPTALRYLCGRNGCHPPGRHSRAGAESRDTPSAFRPDADSPACRLNPRATHPDRRGIPGHPVCIPSRCRFPGVPPAPPGRHVRIQLFGRRRTPATDANRCHTDANHCHSASVADQSAREALSSLPKP